MLPSFFLHQNRALRESAWSEKLARSQQILGTEPLREMHPDPYGDRRRIDVMLKGGRLGLRGPTRDDGSFEFMDLFQWDAKPDTPSPGIVYMMEELVKHPPPLDFAQIRFREGFRSQKGLWIDTANEQIKALLDEGQWVNAFLERGWIIEAGQKHKQIGPKEDGHLGLVPTSEQVWLTSYTADNLPIPLQSSVSTFSQPGPEVNRALIAAGFDLLNQADVTDLPWREWGAGYGNLTAAYTTRLGPDGEASELDTHAVQLLRQNGEAFFPHVLVSQEAAEKSLIEGSRAELWLLDPPRPGFGALLRMLKDVERKPRWILNYHCHESGLAADTEILRELGYNLFGWSAIDAFPATAHLEVVSLWERA